MGNALMEKLLSQFKRLDELGITLMVALAEIIQQTAALADHLEQATARMMILRKGLKVASQFIDAAREQGDLNFRATRVASFAGEFLHDFCILVLGLRINGHWFRFPCLLYFL
jgi:hypothetical protein